MNRIIEFLYIRAREFVSQQDGQDLIEYALVIGLIALAASAGMKTLARDISATLTSIGGIVTGDL